MRIFVMLISILLLGCAKKNEVSFTTKALEDKVISIEGKSLTINEVLQQYKGKKVLIDVWASWCKDCVRGMPNVLALQKEFPEVVFLFISIDKSLQDLKNGIEKYNVKGAHYLLPSGWDGDFGNFLDLSWIPRYLMISEEGDILVFNAVNSKDKRIIAALKNNVH